jgi:hypothetical protein
MTGSVSAATSVAGADRTAAVTAADRNHASVRTPARIAAGRRPFTHPGEISRQEAENDQCRASGDNKQSTRSDGVQHDTPSRWSMPSRWFMQGQDTSP